MKPVAVLRFSRTEGAGRFGEFLERRGVPLELIAVDAGAPVPASPCAYAGIAMMGGPMGVNDPLPWIEPLCELLRDAVGDGIPVIGHCLGGQLLAKALGGTVARAAQPEIGWLPVRATSVESARWFGGRQAFDAFHWHYDTFSPPPGAEPLLESALCANQAFVVDDRHVGMQCHVEMTRPMVEQWCEDGVRELRRGGRPGVQSPEAIVAGLDERLAALAAVADDVYGRWVRSLRGA